MNKNSNKPLLDYRRRVKLSLAKRDQVGFTILFMPTLRHFKILSLLLCTTLLLISQTSSALNLNTPTQALQQTEKTSPLTDEKAQVFLDFAKVWRDLKYLHTGPAYQARDWDQAFIKSAAQLKTASSRAELTLVLNEFMAGLNDPAFRLVAQPAVNSHLSQNTLQLRWLTSDTAYLSLPQLAEVQPQNPLFNQAQLAISQQANQLIIDLRQASFSPDLGEPFTAFLSLLMSQDLLLPYTQSRLHIGYASQTRLSSGGYSSRVVSSTGELLKARGQRDLKLVFIVNFNTPLTPALLALRQRGQAAIISLGEPNLYQAIDINYRQIATLPVIYSQSQLLFAGADDGRVYDIKFSHADFQTMSQAQLDQAALNLLAQLPAAPAVQQTWLAALPRPMPAEPAYAEMALPELAWRELAVIKLWAVIDSFFPYMGLIPAYAWEQASKRALLEMRDVDTPQAYYRVLKRMLVPLSDSHITIQSLTPSASTRVWPAIRLLYAEDQVVVKALGDQQALRAGVEPGDVLVRYNHSPVQTRLHEMRSRISASTEANSYRDALNVLLVDEIGSKVHLQFRKASGKLIDLELRREPGELIEDTTMPEQRAINPQLAYINLASLSETEFAKAIQRYKNHAAIILDLRNYPALLPYNFGKILGADGSHNMTLYHIPVFDVNTAKEKSFYAHHQKNTSFNGKQCRQSKIVLINEYSQSRAEHLGLFIKELCPTVFIGRPSAGTDGDITYTLLPGNLEVGFSGAAVKHANGTQLQRLGLQPTVLVKPTLQDLRTGIDAELAAAINYGMQQFAKARHLQKNTPAAVKKKTLLN